MKKRNGFVSNSSSSSFTVTSADCAWCSGVGVETAYTVIYDGLCFCSMECYNKHIEEKNEWEKKGKKEEPVVEVARFELMDFE